MDDEVKGEGNSLNFGARIYDSRVSIFMSRDPKYREFPFQSPYAYAVNNPIRYIDEYGEGPGDRIKAAKKFLRTVYKQQTELALRTETSKKALEFMDCSELICRVLSADEFTDGVQNMHTSDYTMQNWLKANWKEIKTPKRGDVIIWKGHTALVAADYEEGDKRIKVIHATKYTNSYTKGKVASVVEESYKVSYYKNKGAKYYTPINDMPEDLDEKSKDKVIEKAKISKWSLGWKIFKAIITLPFASPQMAPIKKSEPTIPAYTITADGLNFRKSAGSGNDKLDPLKKGDIVTATGKTEGTWMEVKTESGSTGWISSKPKFTKKN